MKKELTKRDLKNIAQHALDAEYGFAPKLSDITLLEANDNGLYILFSVKNNEYSFRSHYVSYGKGEDRIDTIWAGKGTIEKR